MNLVLLRLAGYKVPVGDRNGSEAVLGHGLDHRLDQPVLVGGREGLHLAAVANDEAALLHDDLGGALGVDPEAAGVQGDDCAHGFPGRVEGVNLLEPSVRHLTPQLNTRSN